MRLPTAVFVVPLLIVRPSPSDRVQAAVAYLVAGDRPTRRSGGQINAGDAGEPDQVALHRAGAAVAAENAGLIAQRGGARIDERRRARSQDVAFDQCVRRAVDTHGPLADHISETAYRKTAHDRVGGLDQQPAVVSPRVAPRDLHLGSRHRVEREAIHADRAPGSQHDRVGVADVRGLGRAVDRRVRGRQGGQIGHGRDHGDSPAAQQVGNSGAQARMRLAVADHEYGHVSARGLAHDSERRVSQGVAVEEELPERTLVRVVHVDDRVEVEAEVDVDDVGSGAERNGGDRLGGRRRGRQLGQRQPRRIGPGVDERGNLAPHVIGDRGVSAAGRPEGLDRQQAGDVAHA